MAEIQGISSSDAQMAALFGKGNKSTTPLDWAKMDLANRSTNAEIAGASQNRDIARTEIDRRSQMEQDRLGFDRERLGFDKEKMSTEVQENKNARQHDLSMKEKDFDQRVQLEQMALNAANEVRAKEFELARAQGEDYRRKFDELMKLKQQSSDAGAKLTAFQTLKGRDISAINGIADALETYGDDLDKIRDEEKDIGTRAARSALRRMFEDVGNSSKRDREVINKLVGDNAAFYTLGTATGYIDVGNALGYQFLTANPYVLEEQSSGSIRQMDDYIRKTWDNWTGGIFPGTRGEAKNYLTVDDSKIDSAVRVALQQTLSRSLSEQTGDKIAPSKIKDVVNYVMNAGEGDLNQQELAKMLSDAGVSAGAIKASLENMANAIDGVDDKVGKIDGFISRTDLNARLANSARDSTDEMALRGMLSFYDRFQQRARMTASQLQTVDIESLKKAADYVRRVKSGDVAFSRKKLDSLIGPVDSRSSVGQMMRDSLLNDAAYERIEGLGIDPIGQREREEARLMLERDNLSAREVGLRGLIDNQVYDPDVYDQAIESLRRPVSYRREK